MQPTYIVLLAALSGFVVLGFMLKKSISKHESKLSSKKPKARYTMRKIS